MVLGIVSGDREDEGVRDSKITMVSSRNSVCDINVGEFADLSFILVRYVIQRGVIR